MTIDASLISCPAFNSNFNLSFQVVGLYAQAQRRIAVELIKTTRRAKPMTLGHCAPSSPEWPAKQPTQKVLITVFTLIRWAAILPETVCSTLPFMSYWVIVKVPENVSPFGPST